MRLFVAVNLPAAERKAAHAAAAPLREAHLPVKWVAEEALHMTLKFLGEDEATRAGANGAALGAAVREVRPFDLAVGGLGAFPDLERPRTFWFGVERHPALELLANDVERALAPFGFQAELKPFQPHLTLGRARKDARPADLSGADAAAARVMYESVIAVGSVDLMESTLAKGGPSYRLVHRAVLGAGR